jgi:beta-galactosidase/beta-glucuronidase
LEFGYPRPQLERPAWTSLNGPWRFQFDNERRYANPSEIEAWPAQITVPYPPESQASGIGDRRLNSACWYERDFEIRPGENRVILHFGAVDYAAKVWVNGALAAEHEGGHTPFSADITKLLRGSGQQTVTVHVLDDPADLAKPRG